MVKTRQQQKKEIEENKTDIAKPEIQSEVFSYKNSSEDVEFGGKYLANEMELDCTGNALDSSLESDSKIEEDDNVNIHITMDGSDVHDCGDIPLFRNIVPENAKRVFKSRLKRSKKKTSKQAHVALGALPKQLDHTWENMTE